QCPRRPRGNLQPSFRLQPDSEIRNRGATHADASGPLRSAEIVDSASRISFCSILWLLHVECRPNGSLAFRPISPDLPWWFQLRGLKVGRVLDAAVYRAGPASFHRVKLNRILILLILLMGGCARDNRHVLLISTADQRMFLLRDSNKIA